MMSPTDLLRKKCKPCEGGMPPLTIQQAEKLHKEIESEWEIVDGAPGLRGLSEGGKKLKREYEFKNFAEAMMFVNDVAAIAEKEGHHPDIYIYYKKVVLEITTHAIGGLSENDFILARKIEACC